jgi:hypothetical protein
MQLQESSRDVIKGRMMRNASVAWDYGEPQDPNSFDPVVGMLIGALAEELYILSGEIKKTDARIIEKMLDLIMSPEVFSNLPAHAIASAKATQPRVSISETYQFSSVSKIPEKINEETVYSNRTVYFTPTSEFKLFRGEIMCLGSGNLFFWFAGQDNTTFIPSLSIREEPDFSTLYIGLKLDPNIVKLDGLSLMFSCKNKQKEELFCNLICNSRWRINNHQVEFRQGVIQGKKGSNLEEIFRKSNDISYRECNFINALYGKRFMMLEEHEYHLRDFITQDNFPAGLKNVIHPNALKKIPGDLFWIEAQLPQAVTPEIINELSVKMNCFPVINRQMNELSQLLTQGINVIPLKTDDQFFDVWTVTDTKGTVFRPVDSFRNGNTDDDIYLLRQGGIARFDSRDAKETLNHLIDLIRDERAGFTLLGADLVSSELKQLDQIISRLKQRLDSNNISNESGTYLMLKCNTSFERATVRYWSVCGEIANNIRPGTKLTLQQGNDVDPNSIILLTGSFGGRQRLSAEEKINKLRRVLLSKGRIVTIEDIKALCFDHFGAELEDVVIKKGVHLDPLPDKGFVRSIDIHLKLCSQSKLTGAILDQKTGELKEKLMQESINLLPFRIFVKN